MPMRLAAVAWLFAGCSSTGPRSESPPAHNEGVRRAVRDHAEAIRNCYERGLTEHPGLTGRVVLQWDIEDTGRTSNVRVVRPLNAVVDDCLALEVENWTFADRPGQGKITRVVFPFVLRVDGKIGNMNP